MRIAIATASVLLVFTGVAHAQEPQRGVDSRWTKWLGCWQLIDESQRASNPDPAELRDVKPVPPATNDVSVCVTPAGGAGAVLLKTLVSGQPAFEQTILADGASHPVKDADCEGTQRVEWSRAGTMLFSSADVVCGDRTPRKTSGLAMLAGSGTWVDVQAIDISGRQGIRVRRYRRAADQAGSTTAPRFGAPLTPDDVEEASGKVAAGAVEAALIATGARFELNSRRLIKLTDGGVPANVIDLMIALSYPERFTVERTSAATVGSSFGVYDAGASYFPSYYAPMLYGYFDPYVDWYYIQSNLAYGPYGALVVPGDSISGGTPRPIDGDGQAINGVGYARVRPREAIPDQSTGRQGNSSNGVRSAGDSSSTSSGSSSGSSEGAATSSGYSGGSSGGDTGRTAQPR